MWLHGYLYHPKVVVNAKKLVVKDTSMIMWELLATIEVVANSTTMVVVVSQLVTTPCAVVKKITTSHILWSLYF
jgi:hypothetical protein